ncbi:hypothetical protein Bca52824_024066 [Brassica carinata]|uniref:DUF7900 domain-containing protein n=1 Tax=Brassica carinata TaxID=52824 RepID=A0A8X7VJE6_BRACI|nr:hypothetical protein Bca52824_024066 [Brassica carinata]
MSSTQNSSSASVFDNSNYEGPPCHCSQPIIPCISWTDENPGRRYFNRELHGFVVWIDKDRPCLWQKRSLLEARDKIRRQSHEIKALRDAVDKANAQVAALELSRTTGSKIEFLKAVEELLQQNVIDSDKKFRSFVVSSWGGFLLATAVLVYV